MKDIEVVEESVLQLKIPFEEYLIYIVSEKATDGVGNDI